jgi:methylated-DNA-[protein]-cysteine S-methyltransferase
MPELQGQGLAAPEGQAAPLRVLLPSPIGPLGLELCGTAVTRLVIDPREPLRATFVPFQNLDGTDVLDEVFGRLSEYFAGARRKLDLAFDLAPCGINVFERRVLKEALKIPYGKTRTYQKLAEAAGRPDAADEVLGVLLGNPIPIVIPCHRVVPPRAEPGAYVAGSDRKRWLLDLEQNGVEE